MSISVVAGARPNFMKIAPLVKALQARGASPRLIHTGQHYDEQMSDAFFHDLHIPEPDVNLGVGSGDAVWQIAELMNRLAHEFAQHRPALVMVVGDVNSTLAASLTAAKLRIPVAHVEAGLRSFDRDMPEELNRIVTDAIADFLFASEPAARTNLLREGAPADRIFLVGNVMIDTLLTYLDCARALKVPEQLQLVPGHYAVLTLHRPSNVDDPERLAAILRAVQEISRRLPVIFPIHPRTQRRIRELGLESEALSSGYQEIPPQGYLAMLGLLDSARLVLTDSGGIQEETTALRVPCITLRENTERPITVEQGSNVLAGWRTCSVLIAAEKALSGPARVGQVPAEWDGRSAQRIADLVLKSTGGDRMPEGKTGAESAELRVTWCG